MLRPGRALRSHLIRRGSLLKCSSFSTKVETTVREKFLKLKESANFSPSVYTELLKHESIVSGQEVEVVEEIIDFAKKDSNVTSKHRIELHNLVLKNLLKYDNSLSMIHQREISDLKGEVDIDSLAEIIKYNSGRVKSSWEIFETYVKEVNSDAVKNQELLTAVLSKLVNGDSSQIEDGYQINEKDLLKSILILKKLQVQPEEMKVQLLKTALDNERFDLINIIGVDSLELISNLEPNTKNFANLWSIWNPQALSKDQIQDNLDRLSKLIMTLSENQPFSVDLEKETLSQLQELEKKYPELSTEIQTPTLTTPGQSFDQLVKILQESALISTPESKYTPLRLSLLKAYGINKQDFKHALYLYHEYISLDKSNVDKIMSTMVVISSYLAVQANDISQLLIAETLIPQPANISSLRALILGYSAFDLEKSLKIFNNNIQNTNKEANDQGTSQAGLLTESLVLANLSKKDREFAYLVHDGAIINEILVTETSKNRLKAVFKRYGEILGEEDEQIIERALKQEVLDAIKAL